MTRTRTLSSIRMAFFDVDGTLSAPLYPHPDGSMDLGFTEEGWMSYCEETKDTAYDHCLPLPPVRAFAEELQQRGARLFVLSSIMSDREPGAKRRFLAKHYPGLFEECYFVYHDGEKVPLIRETAEAAGVPLSSCVLVEDTYSTLLLAYKAGIAGVHVSNIIAGNISV